MGLPTYVTRAISGNPIRENFSTIINAGNVTSGFANNVSLITANTPKKRYGALIHQGDGGASSSGNTGVHRPIFSGKLASMADNNFICAYLINSIAGVANTTLRSPAGDTGNRRAIPKWYGYQRLGVSSVNAWTGAVTYNAFRGSTVLSSGIDGTVGGDSDHAANPTNAVPGEFVWMIKGSAPTQNDYAGKTNP